MFFQQKWLWWLRHHHRNRETKVLHWCMSYRLAGSVAVPMLVAQEPYSFENSVQWDPTTTLATSLKFSNLASSFWSKEALLSEPFSSWNIFWSSLCPVWSSLLMVKQLFLNDWAWYQSNRLDELIRLHPFDRQNMQGVRKNRASKMKSSENQRWTA